MDQYAEELWRISQFIQVVTIFPVDLTLTGSEFQRVGAANEKALVSMCALTLGMKSELEVVWSVLQVLAMNTNIAVEESKQWKSIFICTMCLVGFVSLTLTSKT